MKRRRVAITGLGAVSGLGMNVPALWDGICNLRSSIGPIRNIPTAGLSNLIASEVAGYVQADHFKPREAIMLDRVSQLAVVAAREAVAHANLSHADIAQAGRRIGVIYGASPGQVTLDEGYRALFDQKVTRVHPFTVPRILPAGPACAITIDLGAKGACFATASACATSTHSIGLGAEFIRSGRLDICIGGGSEASIVFGYIKAWEALRLLAPDTPRPFSRDRTGLVLGEAAGAVVLEEWEHARARGVPILAELVGFGMTADAVDMVAPDADSAAAAMQDAIEDADITTADIGYVNAHGTGTRANDRTEAVALNKLFANNPPPTSSLKSQIGHSLNAAGAMETIATVLALQAGLLPATINHREADPECDLDCIPNATRPATVEFALMNSLGFGGLNAVLALRRAA
jgi:nodulation protein E